MTYYNTGHGIEKWWQPGAIKYSPEQFTLLLIPYYEELSLGDYPDPVRCFGRSPNKGNAYYCTAIEIAAEVNFRMNRLPDHGKLLFRLCEFPIEPQYITNDLANLNLRYISGFRRKRKSYDRWLSYFRSRE